MLSLTGTMNYYLCEGYTDMRKGMDCLAELIKVKMGKDPVNGDVFIFLSKNRRHMKLLRYEHSGFILYWKRLDKERFLRPVYSEESGCYTITWAKLVLLLEGTYRRELFIA